MGSTLRGKLSFMIPRNQRILLSIVLSGSGPSLCGYFTLLEGRKPASFGLHAARKQVDQGKNPLANFAFHACSLFR